MLSKLRNYRQSGDNKAYPNLPVMKSSVSLWAGLRNICMLDPDSRIRPSRKKAQYSEMRAACCKLWVTITIVYFFLSSMIRSSIVPGRNWIERGSGLVHEQDFGAQGDCAGDAEPLLLPS